MTQILSLDANPKIKKWQNEFRKLVKGKGEDFKVRFVYKWKPSKKSPYVEYGENSHELVVTYGWDEKMSTRFTFKYPFFITNTTTYEGRKYINGNPHTAMLLELSIQYWTEVAKLSGAKMLIWMDYNRAKRSNKENPPLSEAEKNILQTFNFQLMKKENEIRNMESMPSYGLDYYFLNLDDNYGYYVSSIIQSVKDHLKNHIREKSSSYFSSRVGSRNSAETHYKIGFYHQGFHGTLNVIFKSEGVLLAVSEEEVSYEKLIHTTEDVALAIDTFFNKLYEHQKLKNLVSPPRERFDMLIDCVFPKNWHTNKLKGAGEDIYAFLCSEYDSEVIEEWASTAPPEGKYSYVRENDAIMFNYLDFIFVAKDEWFEAFHISDKEKAYQVYKEKYLEYYYPRVDGFIDEFRKKSGL